MCDTVSDSSRWSWWPAVLVAVLSAGLFFFTADPFLSPPDTAAYWAWGESLLGDLDFEFRDEFAKFRMPVRYTYVTETGRIANDWPMGAGIALVPWIAGGRFVAHAWVAILVAASLALWCRGGAGFSPAAKRFALVGTLLGTPLYFYTAFGPFFSHAVSFAITTAFLVAWDRTRARRTLGEWVLLGLLLGLAGVVRPQNLALGIVFAAEIPGWLRRRETPNSRKLGSLAGGTLIGFAPMMAVYWMMYGSPLALPKAEEMNWLTPAFGKVLLSDFHGVLPWTPVYGLGIVGIVFLGRRDGVLAAGLGLVFLVQLYLNAANTVWWSGGSFGNRRLTDSAIVVAYGLGAIWSSGENRSSARVSLAGALFLACGWTVWLMLAERRLLVPLDRYVPFGNSAFFGELAAVFLEPFETFRALFRGPYEARAMGARALGSLLLGFGVFGVYWGRRRIGRGFSKVGWKASLASAGLLLILTVVSAIRTAPLEDSDLRASIGTEPGILWDNHMELAYYHLAREEWIESEEAARQAVEMEPDDYSAWAALGRALYHQDRWMSALGAFERALELNPGHELSKAYAAMSSRKVHGTGDGETAPSPRE